jgi:hypothetical protein
MVKQFGRWDDGAACLYFVYAGYLEGKFISGLGILLLVELGL